MLSAESSEEEKGVLFKGLIEKEIVICNEVGSGVVPLEADQRIWRDAVGDLSCRLAKRADCVVRMVCGIPQAIKGEVPHRLLSL